MQCCGTAGGFQQAGAEANDGAVFSQRREAGGDDVSRAELQQPARVAAGRLWHVGNGDRGDEQAPGFVTMDWRPNPADTKAEA